jgi:predicted transcriptional regulator
VSFSITNHESRFLESGFNHQSRNLQETRRRLGLTQAQLAARADCSIASIGWMEQGAIPKHSAVLDRVWTVLKQLDAERDGNPHA